MDDQPGLNKMNGSNHNKMLHSFPHLNNGNSHLTTSQPRMSHNVNYTNSTKEISQFKEQLGPKKNFQFQSITTSQGASTKPQLTSSGSMSSTKINNIMNNGQVSNSPSTPKHVPSFLQNRNHMKGSLFMAEQGFSKTAKIDNAFYNNNNNQQNNQKRLPRMSQQPDMKFSAIQLGTQGHVKVPSFLYEKNLKNQKKIPFQNQLERPQSSKQSVFKSNFPIESLSNSYGSSIKKNKLQNQGSTAQNNSSSSTNDQQLDPASEWVKKSWNKKKQKKISINDFEQIKSLGSGKYGNVFLARQKKTNFICALKIIQKKLLKQQQITEQFIRQLKIQSYLNHSNIIKMYGFFDDHHNIYIILQVGTGGQLFKQLKKHQSMPEQKVANIIRQVCQAVNQLHSNHIIHRDIKPQNIVLNQGVVKLCDFGWSVYSGQTLRTTFCGTPIYVGPEILKGNMYNQKIDIWSLGVMMYQMLVGQNPFKITKQQELIKIVKDEIKIPSYVEISEQAKDFLFSCLQKNPDSRLCIRQLLNHSFFKKYPQKSDKKMTL